MLIKSRKSSKTPQNKRQHVTDAEGWTHVLNVSKRGPKSSVTSRPHHLASHPDTLSISQSLAPEVLARQLRRYEDALTTHSPFTTALRHIVTTRIASLPSLRLTQCICLGLGSLTDGHEASKWQLATLIAMLDILASHHHEIEHVLLQDPAFNAADVRYLESIGYRVVETPEAFGMVDEQTFLFAPHLERGIYAQALGNILPATCVGNDVHDLSGVKVKARDDDDDADDRGHEEMQTLLRFGNAMESVPFPVFERDMWCYFTRIYWRKVDMDGT